MALTHAQDASWSLPGDLAADAPRHPPGLVIYAAPGAGFHAPWSGWHWGHDRSAGRLAIHLGYRSPTVIKGQAIARLGAWEWFRIILEAVSQA